LNVVPVPPDSTTSFDFVNAILQAAKDPKAHAARVEKLERATAEHRQAIVQLNAERQALEAEWREHKGSLEREAHAHAEALRADRTQHDAEVSALKRQAADELERAKAHRTTAEAHECQVAALRSELEPRVATVRQAMSAVGAAVG